MINEQRAEAQIVDSRMWRLLEEINDERGARSSYILKQQLPSKTTIAPPRTHAFAQYSSVLLKVSPAG